MSQEKIKCLVWDLDNTIWQGILSEDKTVVLKEEIVEVIKELDNRGVLHSISSKNNFEDAKSKLIELKLWDYFIYPQINWESKSSSIEQIAKDINIGLDTLAFVDDQLYELEEVKFSHPEVMCINANDINNITKMDRMNPHFITSDSKKRRKMYQSDIVRNNLEEKFIGPKEDFLKTLGMELRIGIAKESDLQRAEELTVRTHQLNSTGYTYSYDELKSFIYSEDHILLVADLVDKFGEYGKIGLALIEKKKTEWDLKLLLMSCRVMSKGIGGALLNYIINEANENKVALRAQFIPNDRNRVMYITYKFNDFKEVDNKDNVLILETDTSYRRNMPEFIRVITE